MGSILRVYTKFLKKHPLLTSSVQTAGLMATGDIIAQTLVEKHSLKNLNFVRTAQFGLVGLCFVGPTLTTWYRFLDKRVGSIGTSVVLKKVGLDQFVFVPVFLGFLLVALGAVQKRDLELAYDETKRHYPDVLINNYKLWPCVQLANFYLVPLQYQILIVQTVAIIWNTYLSWKTQRSS